MDNTGLILLSALIAVLFVIFIAATINEFNKMSKEKYTGDK